METNVIKVKHPTENDKLHLLGYLHPVGYDYKEQEKNTTVSINGSPHLRRDDPELKKYQFPKHNPKLKVCTLSTITPHHSTAS
jgi:hypothetical protein